MTVLDPWQEIAISLPEYRASPKKRRKHRVACGRCGCPVHLRGYNYVCPDKSCRGRHGAHKDGTPMGVPGDKETAKARKEAHLVFDRLWKSGRVTRHQAYTILRRLMGMSISEAHIARFSKCECEKLIEKLNTLGDKVFEPPYNTQGFIEPVEEYEEANCSACTTRSVHPRLRTG